MTTFKELFAQNPALLQRVETALRLHAQHGGITVRIASVEGRLVRLTVQQSRLVDGRTLTGHELIHAVADSLVDSFVKAGYSLYVTPFIAENALEIL